MRRHVYVQVYVHQQAGQRRISQSGCWAHSFVLANAKQQQEVCCYAAVLQTLQRAHIGQALLAKRAYSVPARRSGHAQMCELSD